MTRVAALSCRLGLKEGGCLLWKVPMFLSWALNLILTVGEANASPELFGLEFPCRCRPCRFPITPLFAAKSFQIGGPPQMAAFDPTGKFRQNLPSS